MTPRAHPSLAKRLGPAALLCVAALGLGLACSLIVNFNPEGQPCNTQPGVAACLFDAGYYCDLDGGPPGVCRKGGAQTPDAGPCGTSCSPSQICLANRRVCADPTTCQDVACPIGQTCDPTRLTCSPLTSGDLGAKCRLDTDCIVGAGSICVAAAADYVADGGVLAVQRDGFCSLLCTTPAECPTGTTCVQVTSARHTTQVGLCLRQVQPPSTDPLLVAPLQCGRETDCSDFPGVSCMLFDSPALPDAVSFCDWTVNNGAPAGSACSRTSTNPPPSFNGVCLPDTRPGNGVASALCAADSDCPAGDSCVLAEYTTLQGTALLRRVNACFGRAPSRCQPCLKAAQCSADAPTCDADAGVCLARCASSAPCVPDTCDGGCCLGTGYCSCP